MERKNYTDYIIINVLVKKKYRFPGIGVSKKRVHDNKWKSLLNQRITYNKALIKNTIR